MRRKFEAKDYAGLDTGRIVRYREQKRQYADASHEEFFRRWLLQGDSAFRPANPASGSSCRLFRTMLIPHDYDVFGGIKRAS